MSTGNLKSEGSKGSNFTWQHRVLLGLQKGADNTNGLIGVLNSILAANVAQQDMEILLVRDTGNLDQVVQQIREYDETTQTWSTSYEDVSGAVYVPVGPLEYLDPSAVLSVLLAESLDQGLTLDDIESNTATLSTQVLTPGISRPTTSGTIAAGFNSISITNVGAADGTVDGVDLKVGEGVSFDAGRNNTLAALPYDASSTEFLIITLT